MMEPLESLKAEGARTRAWLAWSLALAVAYLAVVWLNWGRTLIATEIWALYFAGQPLAEQLAAIRNDLVHPPLMYIVERVWIAMFGGSDAAAKALPLVFNLPTFFLFPLLAHKVTRHWRLASFLFLAFYFRAEGVPSLVRMYGLGLLLVVIAILLWDCWQRAPRTSTLAAWTVCAVLLVYTHLFGSLLVAAFVALNWVLGPRKPAFTAGGAVAGLAFLPWLLYVLPVYQSRGVATNVWWVNKDPQFAIADFFYGIMGGAYPVASNMRVWLTLVVMVVHVALLALGVFAMKRLGPPRRDASDAGRWLWATVVLTAVPFLLALSFSLLVAPSLHWRFLLGIFPVYWLLVALICEQGGRFGRVALYAVLLPWMLVMTSYTYIRREVPSAMRQAVMRLAEEPQPAELILCEIRCEMLYWEWNRWLGREDRMEQILHAQGTPWVHFVPEAKLGEGYFAGIRRVWFVGAKPPRSVPPVSTVLAENGFQLERAAQFDDVVVEIYRRPAESSPQP